MKLWILIVENRTLQRTVQVLSVMITVCMKRGIKASDT